MARMDYVSPAQVDERTADVLEKNGNKNIFRMLAHSPSHLLNYCRLGSAIRHKGELDPSLRELAILRTGWLCGSEYEVVAHQRIGAAVGLRQEAIEAAEHGPDSPVFTPIEAAVMRFTDEVVGTNRPGQDCFEALADSLSPGALVELHLAIGYYVMTSKFLCTFDIDAEPVP